MTETKTGRGGRRPGAGRPATGNKTYGFSVGLEDLVTIAKLGGSAGVALMIAADDIAPDYTPAKLKAGAFVTLRLPPHLHDVVRARGGAAYIRDLLARARRSSI